MVLRQLNIDSQPLEYTTRLRRGNGYSSLCPHNLLSTTRLPGIVAGIDS